MGLISRHPDAPYEAGDVLQGGSDLEVDIGNLFNEFNGNITGDNFSSTAAIGTTKIADGTIPGDKFKSGVFTTAMMAAAADVSTDVTADAMTTSTDLVDVPSIAAISITPTSAIDIIMVEFIATYSGRGAFAWTFSIGGTDLGILAATPTKALSSGLGDYVTVTYQWAQVAGTASAVVIQPRYKLLGGAGTFATTLTGSPIGMEANKHLTVQLVPG